MRFLVRAKPDNDTAASQARVQAIVAGARAQTPAAAQKRVLYREPVRAPLLPSDDILDIRLAEELAFARRSLESLGDALCDDPILLTRHGTKLQTVDLLAQILGHIAAVVGAADRDTAVGRIGMTELRSRLTRANGTGDEAQLAFEWPTQGD